MKKHLHKAPGKSLHIKEYLLINLFIFAGIGLLSFILFNVSIFNPFTQAFKDFTFTDFYYTQILNKDKIFDSSLVLVNVENKKRDEIAYLLQRLEEGKPKVIGLDIIFPNKIDTAADADKILKETFALYNNIVFPHIASFDNTSTEIRNDPYFQAASNSFVNTAGDDAKYSTLRYYYPVYNGLPHFTTAVLQKYDSSKASLLLKKGQQKTEIRYFGNLQNFKYYNYGEVMNLGFVPEVLKDKMVLLGYLGKTDGKSAAVDEDRFFTPLNSRLSGRSLPDMYGTLVHANILRMAMDKDYIYSFPRWLNLLIAFLLSLFLLPVFVYWYVHKPLWYHLMLVLSQFTISILFLFFTIYLYAWANIKIESANLLVAVMLIGDFLLFYHHLVKYFKLKLKWNIHSKFFESAH